MKTTIKAKAATIESLVRGNTDMILSALSRTDPDLVMRLRESGVLNDPFTLLFFYYYYSACSFLARRIEDNDAFFGNDDSTEAQDIQELSCLFSAAKDLEAAIGRGAIYGQALHDILGNEDLLVLFMAAFVALTHPSRLDRQTQINYSQCI